MCGLTPKISCTTTRPPRGAVGGPACQVATCPRGVASWIHWPMASSSVGGAPLCGRQAFRPRLRRGRAAGTAAGSAAAGCGYNRAPRARHRRWRPSVSPSFPMSVHNPKVGFVSLGCPKALVDSERILTQLRVEGYDIVPTYDDADVVVVNTCGFIDSAVAVSLDAIGEAMNENGKVIVTGCLGKKSEMIREHYPDVLSVSGPQDYSTVMEAVHAALPPRHDPFLDLVPDYGLKLTPQHYAYLKIS